jgi:pullulanase
MKERFECYLDDYSKATVYMARDFYGGSSRMFHLKDSHDRIIPLSIESKRETSTHIVYNCRIEDELILHENYSIFDEHCQSVPARIGHIVKTSRFAGKFDATKEKLGITYTPEKTEFAIWSPVAYSIELLLDTKEGEKALLLKRSENGTWKTEVEGDLLHVPYSYRVQVGSDIKETVDPYNPFVSMNTRKSVVEDISLLDLPKKRKMPELESETDAIIYEASIRDLTSQSGIGVTNPKTFAGFTEENEITKEKNTGFGYIKSLGFTHLQLMPVLDFGSVDECYPEFYYNWGYDPVHFRALEGSYSLKPQDAACRVKEFADLVAKVHDEGMYVNLDLVFNHVWNRETFPLDVLVPNYYFLIDGEGNYSNGSFCGNDFDSRPAMARKYLLETCDILIDLYDIDGFRFDLMGVLDYEFINQMTESARKKKPGFMVYGEGWDMPSFVPEELRATQKNQAKMPGVAQFSDRFRETIRGSNGALEQQGYSNGNTGLIYDAAQVMCGSVLEGRFDTPRKALNYVECHDNHTLWDKNRKACANESHATRERRQILATAMVLTAQGIPFLHAGQEFGRTKHNQGNTYNMSDHFNKFDYLRRNKNQHMVDATKALIKIRKEHPSLRLRTREEIESNVTTRVLHYDVLVYETRSANDHLRIYFNPGPSYVEEHLDTEGTVLFDSALANAHKTGQIIISPVSCVIVQLD